eukprot:TRINITY_DN5618_c0_g1_i6.p1 TRINITY_DN5618_c0_g1~~TRINITY_DN5618_c0_g1_i6.p1  ORF type:complete len:120 (-),score=28.15 TRINITY_DN5618_c0_g1_i6:4-363(-)
MTTYSGCTRQDPHIQYFWQMLREEFDEKERSRFLSFVWGRSRLPVDVASFHGRNFKIEAPYANGPADSLLPSARTCFFSLTLPEYSSLQIMSEKVRYAMAHCVEIDADGDQHMAPQQLE